MKQFQSGRTFIETLSILCLVGIVSVVGLQLYTKVMNMVRSNYIMQQVFSKANELVAENRHKMVDISVYNQDEGLLYGYSFCKDGESCAPRKKGNEVIVQLNGYFPVNLCKVLKKKLHKQEYTGLKTIYADEVELTKHAPCPSDVDINSMTFVVDAEFKNTEVK